MDTEKEVSGDKREGCTPSSAAAIACTLEPHVTVYHTALEYKIAAAMSF